MKKEKILLMVIIVTSIVLAVLGLALLPEAVVIQIGLDGHPKTVVPKLVGIFIPLALSIGSSIAYMKTKNKKMITVGVVGIFAGIMLLVFNH